MLRPIFFHGLLKGILLYILSAGLYFLIHIISTPFLGQDKGLLPIVAYIPILSIFASVLHNGKLGIRQSAYISLSWLFVFFSLDYYLKTLLLGIDGYFFRTYTAISYACVIAAPLIAAISIKDFKLLFLKKIEEINLD